jgi:hypothetical protein
VRSVGERARLIFCTIRAVSASIVARNGWRRSSRHERPVHLVCGWNEDEFQMFGVSKREHDDRDEGQE